MDEKLVVKSRDLKGSSNARRMRRGGEIPGVIYSEEKEARAVSLPKHGFEMFLSHHAGRQMMVSVVIDGKEESLLLKDVQHDIMGKGVLHADFMEVSQTETIKVEISVELVGEAEGVKTHGGVLDHTLYSIEVNCLPKDMLEGINVDVSALNIGDVLTVSDIQIDVSKYEILTDRDAVIACVLAPRKAVDETAEGDESGTGAEPEVIKEKKESE